MPRPPLCPRIGTLAWPASHRRDANLGFRTRLSSSAIPPGTSPSPPPPPNPSHRSSPSPLSIHLPFAQVIGRRCSLRCLPGAAALGRGSPGTGATRRGGSGSGSPATDAPHAAAAWPGPNCRFPGVMRLPRRTAHRRVPPVVRLGCSGRTKLGLKNSGYGYARTQSLGCLE